MIIKKMTYISLLTAILFVVKLIFGFIAGVEFVTTLILLYALFLPFNWTIIITTCFIIMCGLFYGFGPWWVIYWFIWPTEITLTWLFRKILSKNNVIFSFWACFWGFSIIFWYAIPNYLVGGSALVIASFLSGSLFNLTEGLCNFVEAIFLFYPIKKLFRYFILNNENFILIRKRKPTTTKET